jgi:polysaccharide biosynthesis protein PslH
VKILYLAHRIPYPPNKGEKIRTFNQIQQLARRHAIHLCSFVDEPKDLRGVSKLREHCASVEIIDRRQAKTFLLAAVAFLKRTPLSVSLFYRKALAEKVAQKAATGRFDCIIVSCSSMAQYVPSGSALPKIIDFIDVDSEKWRSYAKHCSFPLSTVYRSEAYLLGKYEEQLAREFDHCILSSAVEAQFLRNRAKDRPISVISNGVDLEYFTPRSHARELKGRPIIVFTGVMDYFPNVDAVKYFCSTIFPIVLDSVPDAQFYIVGRNPTRQVKDLGKQINVIVTGTVADVRPYLEQARVAVAPFRLAHGVQNKVLEAMAMGLPVVGTAETFKGIAATEQDGIRIARDPLSFAEHVTTFLGNTSFGTEIGQEGRRLVERHHRWEDQGIKLEEILQQVMRRNPETKYKAVAVA